MSHFVFDLTCDVTGDTGVNFFNFIWKISSSTLYCRLNFWRGLRLVYAERNGLHNCYLGFFKISKVLKILIFFNIFLWQKIALPPNYKFSKNLIISTIRATKNICTKFRVIPFINVFIAFWMREMAAFSRHLKVAPCISINSFYFDFYATNDGQHVQNWCRRGF